MKLQYLTIMLIATLIATIYFFLLPPILANEFSSPVVTIVFDDGKISQYQYAYPLMKARGIIGTFYIVSDLVRDISGNYKFMSFSEIRDLQNSGNEIGSHSCNHPSFTGLTEEEIRYECSESKNILEANGLTVENFAYPYGSTNDFVDSIVSEYYRSARTLYTSPYVMSLLTSQFRITALAGETGDSNALPRLRNELDQLTANQWLIIVFHNVESNVSDKPYTISTQDFEEFLDYIALKGFETLTVNQTLDLCSSEDTAPPVISILFPENKTYTVKDVPLNFTVNETSSWMGYSLDGQANVTITGNTTLVGLLDGSHSLAVYANDTVGNMGVSSTVYFTVDTTPPNITDASQTQPENKVLPEDEVKVNATVIDDLSGVKQVTLNYTNGNGTWVIVEMTNLEGNVWNGTIPAFEYCTWVNYVVIAEDKVGNIITTEEALGYQYQYHVIPEFPSFPILLLFMVVTILAVTMYRSKHSL